MQVRDVMIPVVGHLEPDMSLRDAAERMKALNMNPMPVVENGTVVGVLSEQHLMDVAGQDGLAVGSRHVREVMSKESLCCSADQSVEEALQQFDDKSTGRMPVVDDQKHLVGIVSRSELERRERLEQGEVTAVDAVESVSDLVQFDEDQVDFMSDASFPASDPLPPPTILGPCPDPED